ncbi:MAG: SIR2 family protein [Parcubacteria group bacterium]|nr:SIR2 family protein [Parcubacteria group bacterium]
MPIYKKTILLTGAGFSKNFGGFLGREMWSKIFNNPKLTGVPSIKKELRTNFDFESVYANVLRGSGFSVGDRDVFQEVIIDAYDDMDKMLGQYRSSSNDPYQIDFAGVSRFLALFVVSSGGGREVGLHFTLNQDLFLENRVGRRALGLGSLQYKNYTDAINAGRIDSSLEVRLPTRKFIDEFEEKYASDLLYIKLHGSSGWLSSTGSRQMVLGNNKLADIMQEPLLEWYFEIFEEALYRDGVKLFICGYGFRDSHINERIVKAVREHGLKIYIISPTVPEELQDFLIGKPSTSGQIWSENEDGKSIWSAVDGYFPYEMKEIFPFGQRDNDKKDALFNAVTC